MLAAGPSRCRVAGTPTQAPTEEAAAIALRSARPLAIAAAGPTRARLLAAMLTATAAALIGRVAALRA